MTPIIGEKELLNLLPHGNGIDSDWRIKTLKNGNVVAYNSWHHMDEWGYYAGWYDFHVKLFRHKTTVKQPLKGPLAGKTQIVHRIGDIGFTVHGKLPWGVKDMLYECMSLHLETVLTPMRNEII